MMGGFGYGMFGGGALLMLVFWALVIGGAVWLVVTLGRGNQVAAGTASPGQSPVDLLKVRYAKGEITKEQFDAMKRDLGA